MTGVDHSDRKGDMREKAATWFAAMRGPDAEIMRKDFEAWLAQDPLHREAYSRIAEIFSLGKGLTAPVSQRQPAVDAKGFGRIRQLLIAMSLVVVPLAGGAWMLDRLGLPFDASGAMRTKPAPLTALRAEFATRLGQISRIRLADGSVLTLDTNSKIDIVFDRTARHLRLRSGRARFDVAHESRPFVVSAGMGQVTAHGTVFDVALQPDGRVAVRLLRGVIDVALPGGTSGMLTRKAVIERLSAGQQVVMAETILTGARTLASPIDVNWPTGKLDCDRAPLATVARAANRYGDVQIELADPAIGNLRVSGTIRIDEPRKLADRLALLFDLRVDRSHPSRLVLRSRAPEELDVKSASPSQQDRTS